MLQLSLLTIALPLSLALVHCLSGRRMSNVDCRLHRSRSALKDDTSIVASTVADFLSIGGKSDQIRSDSICLSLSECQRINWLVYLRDDRPSIGGRTIGRQFAINSVPVSQSRCLSFRPHVRLHESSAAHRERHCYDERKRLLLLERESLCGQSSASSPSDAVCSTGPARGTGLRRRAADSGARAAYNSKLVSVVCSRRETRKFE